MICCTATPLCRAATIDTTTLIRAYLKNQLADLNGREPEHPELVHLYASRGDQPLWTKGDSVTLEAQHLLEHLAASPSHGLNSEAYQLSEVRKRFQKGDVIARAELDLMLTRRSVRQDP